VDLVRDLLDKRVVDRNGREVGRVDRVWLDLSRAEPRVEAIEIGVVALADRLHAAAGRWMRGIEVALGINEDRPMRVPMAQVLEINDHVKIDVAVSETPAFALERRLRQQIGKLPGT
jgi:sporulation protein YlmC with PRC-barrel domain